MKKIIYPIFLAAVSLCFAACSHDDKNDPDNPDKPGIDNPGPDSPDEPASKGMFIVNAGTMYSNIDGSLWYYDYSNGNVSENIFKKANNNMTVGDVFNDGYILDDKIYLAVTNSAVLHILNRENYKLLTTISTNPEAGPRHITSYNGKIYMTLFGQPGYVAEVDPEKMEITRQVEVGPLPEYIVPFENKLYVTVSDGYMNNGDACVAVIDPESFTVTEKITGLVNPVNLTTNGKELFVCAWGQYMTEPPYSQYNYGVYQIKGNNLSDKINDGTYIYQNGDKLYYMSNPYGTDIIKYGVYNVATGKDSEWIPESEGVEYPISLASDPITGDVFILSYHRGESGYGAYDIPGYIKQYKADGTVVKTFDVGISPVTVFFNVYE